MNIQCHPPLILASESPARRQLLAQVALPFTAQASPFDEEAAKASHHDLSVEALARLLAHGKAKAVSEMHPDHLVLAADQIASLDGQAIFKPLTEAANVDLLCALSGKTHHQHSAACLYFQGQCLQDFHECIAMHMHPLTREACAAYVAADQPMRCCAGYRFEGRGRLLFSAIEGSTEGVMGLPLMPIFAYLREAGYLRW